MWPEMNKYETWYEESFTSSCEVVKLSKNSEHTSVCVFLVVTLERQIMEAIFPLMFVMSRIVVEMTIVYLQKFK